MSDLTLVKLGGSLLDDAALRSAAIEAIAAQWRADSAMVIVHGGGRNIDAALGRAGIPKRVVEGLRVTDDQTLEVVVGVLAGSVNKRLVAELGTRGVAAAGLSGADGAVIEARPHPPIGGIDLGRVGQITRVDPALVIALLGAGFLPVVGSLACSADGSILNVNADAAAAALATALAATRLVFLTDVEGLLDSDGSIVSSLRAEDAAAILESPLVTGGMKPKLRACVDALAGGVAEVVIAGPNRHALSLAGGTGGTHLVAA